MIPPCVCARDPASGLAGSLLTLGDEWCGELQGARGGGAGRRLATLRATKASSALHHHLLTSRAAHV